MIFCKVFQQDLSCLNSDQIIERCMHCLERDKPECTHMEAKEDEEPELVTVTEQPTPAA